MSFRAPLSFSDESVSRQMSRFPTSRYMGSKHAVLPFLHDQLEGVKFKTVLDAFSGSGSVGYLLKCMGKSVTCNDFLNFAYHTANAAVANSQDLLCPEEVAALLSPHPNPPKFIEETFSGLYYSDAQNRVLDNLIANAREMRNPAKQSIAYAAIARACLRLRPRGIYTYTGIRYLDGRRDLTLSLEEHFRGAVKLFNEAVFDNGQPCHALNRDVFTIPAEQHYDLVYFDPPYVSPHSDNDYTRRYHFVEGLTRYWEGLEIQHETTTKKFRRLASAFDSKRTIHDAFSRLFEGYRDSTIVVSYSSNSIPNKEEMTELLGRYKTVTVYEQDHRYSFGTHGHKVGDNQNAVKEYLFIGK